MEWIVSKEAFLKPLRTVSGAFEKKTSLPILSNVLIQVRGQSFRLIASDQEIEIEAEGRLESLIEAGETTVPYRKLLDICALLPDGAPLSFKEGGGKLRLTAGKSRFDLITLPAHQMPKKKEETGKGEARQFKISATLLRELFRRTAFVMGDKNVRHYMSGTLLEIVDNQIYAVTIDGHRVAIASSVFLLEEETPFNFRVIIPKKGVTEVQKVLEPPKTGGGEEKELLIGFGERHWQVTGSFFTITSRLFGGDYPPYESFLHPLEQGNVLTVAKEALRKALYRGASLLSEVSKGARFSLSFGVLKIFFMNVERDEAEEVLDVAYPGAPFDIEICFNVRYLLDFLSVVPHERVQFTLWNEESSARVEGVGSEAVPVVYVIMPMQL